LAAAAVPPCVYKCINFPLQLQKVGPGLTYTIMNMLKYFKHSVKLVEGLSRLSTTLRNMFTWDVPQIVFNHIININPFYLYAI